MHHQSFKNECDVFIGTVQHTAWSFSLQRPELLHTACYRYVRICTFVATYVHICTHQCHGKYHSLFTVCLGRRCHHGGSVSTGSDDTLHRTWLEMVARIFCSTTWISSIDTTSKNRGRLTGQSILFLLLVYTRISTIFDYKRT